MVGMADYKVCHCPQRISTLGLGSCLGVVLYDSTTKMCGMAHVMMPDSTRITDNKNRKKFADTCLFDMYAEMLERGALKKGIVAKIAGGATMFSNQNGNKFLNIGQQNTEAVRKILDEWKIPIVAEDVGSTYGRTIEFNPETGELFVKSVGVGTSVI